MTLEEAYREAREALEEALALWEGAAEELGMSAFQAQMVRQCLEYELGRLVEGEGDSHIDEWIEQILIDTAA